MKAQSERPDIPEMPPYRLGVCLLTVPVLRAASASARRRFSSSMNFMSISLSHSGKRLRWIVCQWRPSLYLTPFSLLSSMCSPRQSAPCANWNISASKSTRSTRSTRPSKKVLQLPLFSIVAAFHVAAHRLLLQGVALVVERLAPAHAKLELYAPPLEV